MCLCEQTRLCINPDKDLLMNLSFNTHACWSWQMNECVPVHVIQLDLLLVYSEYLMEW